MEPTDISADKGQVVTLTCAADGSPQPSYIWYRNSDINQVLYTVQIVPALLSRQTCRRTRVRWWRWPAQLTAHPRPATSGTGTQIFIRYCTYCTYRPRLFEPTDISADKGQVVVLTCAADGSPPPTYIWYRNSDINQVLYLLYISSPPCWADGHLRGQGPGGDADLRCWRLTPAQLHLVQELGYQSGTVHFKYRPRLVEPTDISADKGQVVTLTWAADSSPPPSYIWYRNSDIYQVLYLLYILSPPCWADGHLRGQGPGGGADLRGWRLTPAQLHLVQELRHQSGIVLTVHIVPALLSRQTSPRTRASWWRCLRSWRLTPAQLHLVQELRYLSGIVLTVHIVPALLSRRTSPWTRARWWCWPARLTAHPRPATSGTGTQTSTRYCTLYTSSPPCWADRHLGGQGSGGDADLRGLRLTPAQLHLVQELRHQIRYCTMYVHI